MQKASLKSKFIEAMDLLQLKAEQGPLTIEQIIEILGEECHPILLLLLSLPYIIPVSIPGVSTASGLLICVVAVMHFFNKPPWIPKKFKNIAISNSTVVHISTVAEKIWIKVSHLVHERWVFLNERNLFKTLNLAILIFNGVLLALPLPIPLTNTLPGVAIIICSLGYVEKDGLFIFLSYLWTLLVFVFFTSLALGASQYLIST